MDVVALLGSLIDVTTPPVQLYWYVLVSPPTAMLVGNAPLHEVPP